MVVYKQPVNIILHVAWESDPVCRDIIATHFPNAFIYPNLFSEDHTSPLHVFREALYDHRLPVSTKVLILAGPPCPDFSIIKHDSEGSRGTEGRKFLESVRILRDIMSISKFPVFYLY